jgi:predicted O-methyltransferase YrrM
MSSIQLKEKPMRQIHSQTLRSLLILIMLAGVALVAAAQRRGFGRTDTSAPPLAKNEAEKKILGVLDAVVREQKTYLSVPMADGRMLRLLVEAAGAKQVVEIGTSTGYSGLWICLALHATGGRLTTFEYDRGRAAMAREHFTQAGVGNLVTVVEGDAHVEIARVKGPIDVVFIDADKEGYVDYLNKLLPLVRPGGLLLAHNVDAVPDYIRAVTSNPDLDTILYMDGAGLAVTLKKR